jgi:hypothetical protein
MEWINVQERLPPKNEKVFVCYSDNTVGIAYYGSSFKQDKHSYCWINYEPIVNGKITHWTKVITPHEEK